MPAVIDDGFDIADEQVLHHGKGIADKLKLVGRCVVQVFDENGVERDDQRREIDNLVVTTGRDAIMERLDSSPSAVQPTHMAVGTGAVAPVAGNTALGAEVDRNALTSSIAAGAVLTMVGNWAAGDATNGALTEAGVFSQAAGTDATHPMYSRATFGAVNKGALDTLQITWTYTLTPS